MNVAVMVALIPIAVFAAGVVVFGRLGQTRIIEEKLRASPLASRDKTALWKRFGGYDAEDVQRFVSVLGR